MKLINEFGRVGLLPPFYHFFKVIKFSNKFSIDDFPKEEKKLFENMGLTEDEVSLMVKIINEYIFTSYLSVDEIFEISQHELAQIRETLEIDKKKKLKYRALGGFKIISGASFAGYNILGYFATNGISINFYNLMASFVGGAAFMEAGIRDFKK